MERSGAMHTGLSHRLTFAVERIEVFRLLQTFTIVDQRDNRIKQTVDRNGRARIDDALFQQARSLREIICRASHVIDHSTLTFRSKSSFSTLE